MLFAESNVLHQLLLTKIIHFFKHSHDSLFTLCNVFKDYNIEIDLLFNKAYDYFLKPSFIQDISISSEINNTFIKATQQAINQQSQAFLYYFAKSISSLF